MIALVALVAGWALLASWLWRRTRRRLHNLDDRHFELIKRETSLSRRLLDEQRAVKVLERQNTELHRQLTRALNSLSIAEGVAAQRKSESDGLRAGGSRS